MSPRCPIFSTSWVSMTCMRLLPSYHVRQKRHLAGTLYRGRGLALVLRAEAGDPAGPDLATVGGEPPERVVVLVVNVGYVLLAEHARLALGRARSRARATRACAPVSSPTHPENLPVSKLARGLGWLRQRPVGVRRREPHDHVSQHVVRDAQDALQLHEGTLAGAELHDGVEAV